MELKDYIQYYAGAEFLFDQKTWKIFRIETTGKGVLVTGKRFFATGGWRHNTIWADQCKPLLRQLEDMTEGEMIGLLQSMVPDEMEDKPADDDYDLNLFKNDGGNLVDRNVAIGAEYTCSCYIGQITIKNCGTICAYDETGDEQELVNAPRAYHYLLQQGFDLFGLIPAGLAIDAKTLTP